MLTNRSGAATAFLSAARAEARVVLGIIVPNAFSGEGVWPLVSRHGGGHRAPEVNCAIRHNADSFISAHHKAIGLCETPTFIVDPTISACAR